MNCHLFGNKLCAVVVCFVVSVTAVGCSQRNRSSKPRTSPAVSQSAGVTLSTDQPRIAALRRVENTRSCLSVDPELLASPHKRVRRAAARALARCRNPRAESKLTLLLSDGDEQTLAWAAFGLAQVRKRLAPQILPRLAVRAVSFRLDTEAKSPSDSIAQSWRALALAVAASRSLEAEQTLAAWLDGPAVRRHAAVIGLGKLASQRHRLEEETSTALLRVANGTATFHGDSFAFYPFSRLPAPPVRLRSDLLDACRHQLHDKGDARIMAVRLLGMLGDDAVGVLGDILRSVTEFSAAERAEAARGLGKIGSKKATRQLLRSLTALAPSADPVALSALVGPSMGPLLTNLESLGRVRRRGRPMKSAALLRLATLPVLKAMPSALSNRVVMLRCEASSLLAGRNVGDPRLFSCDPDPHGLWGGLAKVRVLDRAKLKRSRAATWRRLVYGEYPPRVREAALRLIEGHPELDGVDKVVSASLTDPHLGVVTVAADQVAADPSRYARGGGKSLVQDTLREVMDKSRPADAVETESALARASGALGISSVTKRLQGLCRGDNPTLRLAAERALNQLLDKKVTCPVPDNLKLAPAKELGHLAALPVRVTLKTAAGTLHLTLEPSVAPVVVTRVVDLVGKGFYRGLSIHRVVPGFVVQFGDPDGDGYGGAGLPPLRDEFSPKTFGPLHVGVATAGEDTGSTQIFVTLSATPHLDGAYTWIGTASGPWDSVVEGDKIDECVAVAVREPTRATQDKASSSPAKAASSSP